MLHEFIAERFPGRDVVFNVRVGDISPEEKADAGDSALRLNAYRARLPRADAIVFDGSTVWIIEAKLEAEQKGAAQLTTYRMLLPKTPVFAERAAGKKVRTLLVLGRESKIMEDLCRELGHEFVVSRKAWSDEYLASRGVVRLSWGTPL